MVERSIRFRSFKDIERFVREVDTVPYRVELCSNQEESFVFRASSVIGICSMDLSRPVLMRADTDDAGKVQQDFAPYLE